ncbi:hypothetical protein BK809_0001892 [Diplodia seriata]|uniref:Fungal N-terminal domain-containing protein n=1 Tax=Diplodia seriata TaxID=420778 RepID=A0A1S8BB74_9PEZI|nr:hypothetical protein BK809_0001892 [Diplodia seriata]
MSDPFSILGTALAVASVASTLSIKLFEIGNTIRNAPKEVETIASELSTAASILYNVRDTISGGMYLIKAHLIADMGSILYRFGEVNSEISKMIDKKKKRRLSLAALMVFKERHVKDLMAKVESLKLSMNLIMNTVLLATALDASDRKTRRRSQEEEHVRVIRTIVQSGVENSRRNIDKQQRFRKQQKKRPNKMNRQIQDASQPEEDTATWLYQLIFSPARPETSSEQTANATRQLPAPPVSAQEASQGIDHGILSTASKDLNAVENVDETSTNQNIHQTPENSETALIVLNESTLQSQEEPEPVGENHLSYAETPKVVESLLGIWTYLHEIREQALHEEENHRSSKAQRRNYREIESLQHPWDVSSHHRRSRSKQSSPVRSSDSASYGATRTRFTNSDGSEYCSDNDEHVGSFHDETNNTTYGRAGSSARHGFTARNRSPRPSNGAHVDSDGKERSNRNMPPPRWNRYPSGHSSFEFYSDHGSPYARAPSPPPAPLHPPDLTPAEKRAMARAVEQSERLKKLEELLMQQAVARTDKEAAKKKAIEDAAAAAAEAKKVAEEDKLAKVHDLLIAQRDEQRVRDEAIAAARAAEKAEADAKAARIAEEKARAAEDAAKLLAAAKKAREEAEAKAAEEAKAAKEVHERVLAKAMEELKKAKEEAEHKASSKGRPDMLLKLSRKWSRRSGESA